MQGSEASVLEKQEEISGRELGPELTTYKGAGGEDRAFQTLQNLEALGQQPAPPLFCSLGELLQATTSIITQR